MSSDLNACEKLESTNSAVVLSQHQSGLNTVGNTPQQIEGESYCASVQTSNLEERDFHNTG